MNLADYYISHYYAARCYARDYLKQIADGDESLLKAAEAYEKSALLLKPLWDFHSGNENIDAERLKLFAEMIRKAKTVEGHEIHHIKEYLE